jgi:hypothetical protein
MGTVGQSRLIIAAKNLRFHVGDSFAKIDFKAVHAAGSARPQRAYAALPFWQCTRGASRPLAGFKVALSRPVTRAVSLALPAQHQEQYRR